jgi:hypothetical protein
MYRDGDSAHRQQGKLSARAHSWIDDPRKMIRALTWTKAIRNSVIEKCLNWSEGIKSLGSTPDHTCR